MLSTPLQLNDDHTYVLNAIEKEHKNVFVTGRAGTGKSTLLQLFRNTTKKNVVVVAPTGIAALNVQGQTIHSFFGFPAKPITKKDIKPRKFRKVFEKLEVLIIDEISMVRADMLDNINHALRVNRKDPRPFGGVQVVFFGDLFQLPPIVKKEEEHIFKMVYDSAYFFDAHVIREEMEMEMIELRHIYRQNERHFIRLLDAVRLNRVDRDDLEDLNIRHQPRFHSDQFYITICARNFKVNQINDKKLQGLDAPAVTFTGNVEGNFDARLFPVELHLILKEGAQVMFVKNDTERRYVNGTIGIITGLTEEKIVVEIQDAQTGKISAVEVEKDEWEILKYKIDEEKPEKIKTEVIGTFKQYPLKLAWAITIHKSQGKTFEKVIIDLGKGAFAHGQTYVALSRCKTLEGIVLKQALRFNDIMVDERIVEFYEGNV